MVRLGWWFAAAIALGACNGGDGGDGGDGDGATSESCRTQWDCINDSCSCSAGPNEGSSCEHPDDSSGSDNCDDYCEYCE